MRETKKDPSSLVYFLDLKLVILEGHITNLFNQYLILVVDWSLQNN